MVEHRSVIERPVSQSTFNPLTPLEVHQEFVGATFSKFDRWRPLGVRQRLALEPIERAMSPARSGP